MARVKGIGGIFFKTRNLEAQKKWYEKHLGLDCGEEGCVVFKWRQEEDPERSGSTVWSPFPADTQYFSPGTASFMINYRVDNLRKVLDQLRKEGVQVDDKIEESEFGKFGWIQDPEGNRIELWEPPEGM